MGRRSPEGHRRRRGRFKKAAALLLLSFLAVVALLLIFAWPPLRLLRRWLPWPLRWGCGAQDGGGLVLRLSWPDGSPPT